MTLSLARIVLEQLAKARAVIRIVLVKWGLLLEATI